MIQNSQRKPQLYLPFVRYKFHKLVTKYGQRIVRLPYFQGSSIRTNAVENIPANPAKKHPKNLAVRP